MKVLVACEESQVVCKAFRALGHEAYSCDIQECSGGHPEWHIRGDALDVLNPKDHGNNTLDAVWFTTMDGCFHEVPKWDLIIAHPPCTYLTVSGNRWFNEERYEEKARQRKRNRRGARSNQKQHGGMTMATWNTEIIQMIKIAADAVGERQDIYISIFAADDNINITVYPWKGEEEE